MIPRDAVEELQRAASSPDDGDLPRGALVIARIEHPHLDPAPSLARLTRLGALAMVRLERLGRTAGAYEQIAALNQLLFEDEGFHPNEDDYEDPRNSMLNDVLERRTGIPITLSLVFMEVARRCGVHAEGVNFPGHFLVKGRSNRFDTEEPHDIIIDPFNRGAVLTDAQCRELLRRVAGDEAVFDRRMLAPVGRRGILVRMLNNVKRLYVGMRSFPQARDAVDLLLALDPLAINELRDRGLIAYHLDDHVRALRDLEAYLRATSRVTASGTEADGQPPDEEHREIWDHVKALRRRIAGMN